MARRRELSVPQAALLGALHGPAELLPVSSSAHTVLALQALGVRMDPGTEKAFEVALHAGTALALLPGWRPRPRRDALALAPALAVGVALEHPIERHLRTRATLAAGLLVGAAALAAADALAPQRRDAADDADMVAVGLAQACALWPGVSRAGATVAAARARGLRRPAAAALSLQAGVPVLLAAAAGKGLRLAVDGLPRELRAPFAAGTAASLVSTVAARRALSAAPGRPLWPFAAYRAALAAFLLVRRPQWRA